MGKAGRGTSLTTTTSFGIRAPAAKEQECGDEGLHRGNLDCRRLLDSVALGPAHCYRAIPVMTKKQMGWKVVRRNLNGDFQSARINAFFMGMPRYCNWSVIYKPSFRSTGWQGTPLLAFRTRAYARSFKDKDDIVFRAELENPRPIDQISYWRDPEGFASFWNRPDEQHTCWYAPPGTLACDAITLLEPA